MTSSANTMHRRKSSRETEGPQSLVVTITEPATHYSQNGDDFPQTQSQAQNQSQPQPLSPRKLTTSAPDPPPNGIPFPPSPSRQRVLSTPSPNHRVHHIHTRAPSTSSFYSPASSPLVSSFPLSPHLDLNTSSDMDGSTSSAPVAHRPAPLPPRRHTRIHSRNLSVFFPRPGAGPPSIAEDGIQEDASAPETLLPSNGDGTFQQGRDLSSNFTFGGRSPENGDDGSSVAPSTTRVPRRGHHHKHSLSHNFFSFMEPDSHDTSFAAGAPTPVLSSDSLVTSPTAFTNPWTQRTPSPKPVPEPIPTKPPQRHDSTASLISIASASALIQFFFGAFLWMCGQEVGSLSCSGLGYWVVFDAFGIALSKVLPKQLALSHTYGNARMETLAMFVQSIYLIFASVYVCKEAVEHALLTHDQGHHHHHHHRADELEGEYGIDFPIWLILTILGTLLVSSFKFDNNSNIVVATSNRLPSLTSLFEPDRYTEPTSPIEKAFSNPYTVLPFTMGLCIIGIWGLGNASYHRQADLLLAFVMAVITFWASYPAAIALGKILLQTAPERRIKRKGIMRGDGRMEAFLRVMREFERHPQIQHLPPPHIWQLTPSVTSAESREPTSNSFPTLVITLELHISQDLDDESILKLTKWAWERCMNVLGGAADVTVGIVRG